MKKAILLGTSHPIQRGKLKKDSFYSHLHELCKTYNIKAIAEEIDDECTYIAEDVSTRLNIKYQIIEPNEEERIELGIEDRAIIDYEFEFKYKVDIDKLPPKVHEEHDKRTQDVYRKRESEWLKRVLKLDTWPVLIICGADHYQPFFELLSKEGIETVKESSKWDICQDT